MLDLGCGSGILLKNLIEKKQIKGRGIDIDEKKIIKAVENGISVSRGDIDQGLGEYRDQSYDFVILSRTLQVLRRPKYVIEEMLRVGKKAIVNFPNFGYWEVRQQLYFEGKMPITKILPFKWYNTPNIHSLTILDFQEFCQKSKIKILKEVLLTKSKKIKSGKSQYANFFAEEGLYVITRT